MPFIASTGTYVGASVDQHEHIDRVRLMHGLLLDKVSRDPRIEKRQLHEYDGANTITEKNIFNRTVCLMMAKEAAVNAIDAWDGSADDITHVIVCTSTDYKAPSIDVCLIEELGLSPSVKRIPVIMAGCAGGGIALQMGHDIVKANDNTNVLIVATECASSNIHRPASFSINTAIATTIFSDGAGAAIISGKGKYMLSNPTSYTVPGTLEDMEIRTCSEGIDVILSPKIHIMTSEVVPMFVKNMTKDRVDGYIVHPGGKSILEAVGKKINDDLTYSWDILRQYGNTSSASIFYVLHHALGNLGQGRYPIITFGQGLHISGILLHVN